MSLLKITNLQVSYGGIDALAGISFDVEEGEIVTLIGANGAGKSTTLRTISGLVKAKAGRIVYDGRDITSMNPQKIVSEGIAMVPEGRHVFDNLTVKENLLIGANGAGKSTTLRAISGLQKPQSGSILYGGEELTGLPAKEIVRRGIIHVPEGRRVFPDMTVAENLKIGAFLRRDSAGIASDMDYVYTLFPRLKERSWQLAGTLSGGEQQMLAVGRAMMAKPKLMMMDEPSLGLAPLVVKDIFSIIRRVNEDGITVLLIEQNANAALRVAHYGYVLETGTITLTGTGEELLRNESVREAYLGKRKA